MRIAHFGTFDVENFGDLLLPRVLERRLAGREIVHVSPTGGPPVWGDCVATIPTREAFERDFDAVVVGGGHLIQGHPANVSTYRDAPGGGLFAYVDLWLGATRLACEREIAIVWNAPGVPGTFASETAAQVRWAAAQADHLVVRDETSRRFLREAGCAGEIGVVCDTAIETASLFRAEELEEALRDGFATRGRSLPALMLAVHFNARLLGEGVREIAAQLDALCRAWKLTPVLLALGPCHGDAALAREIAGALTVPHCLIDAPGSLRELVACIGASLAYVGTSLHGAIAARSFGRPAVLVAREAVGGHAKFSGFAAVDGALGDGADAAGQGVSLVESWREAFARVDLLMIPGRLRERRRFAPREAAGSALDDHWQRVVQALEAPAASVRERRSAGRAELAGLLAERWHRESAYIGILLDQAREAARLREVAQKNTERFRELDRIHRDLKQSLRGGPSEVVAAVPDGPKIEAPPATRRAEAASAAGPAGEERARSTGRMSVETRAQADPIEAARQRLIGREFGFIDGGCGAGGSLAYCERTFNRGRGLGLDASSQKVEQAIAAGHVAYLADLTEVELPKESVSFVSFLDFLEHLPDVATTKQVLAHTLPAARDFLFIRHPNFEETDYLASLDLKLDWTDWHGHRNMMTLAQLRQLLRELDLGTPTILGQKPISDSGHRSIVPLDAPADTVGYDADRHGAKRAVRFERPIYSQFDVFVKLDRGLSEREWDLITGAVVNARNATVRFAAGLP